MSAAASRAVVVLCLAASLLLGCVGGEASTTDADGGAQQLAPLDLQVRNSGLKDGGYLWLAITGGAGRWHRFGQAELVCVTCPVPFGGVGPSYDIAVFDLACQLRGRFQTTGGSLQVAIDLGPSVTLVAAPAVTDWMPSDSTPVDAGDVPCAQP